MDEKDEKKIKIKPTHIKLVYLSFFGGFHSLPDYNTI